jgi:hypothetical protein
MEIGARLASRTAPNLFDRQAQLLNTCEWTLGMRPSLINTRGKLPSMRAASAHPTPGPFGFSGVRRLLFRTRSRWVLE